MSEPSERLVTIERLRQSLCRTQADIQRLHSILNFPGPGGLIVTVDEAFSTIDLAIIELEVAEMLLDVESCEHGEGYEPL